MAAEVEFISAIVVIGRPVRFDASTLPGGVDNNSVRQLLLVVLREKEANKKSASYCTLVQ